MHPGCITYGETISEAIAMARAAIELYLESLVAHGEEIPTEESTLEYRAEAPGCRTTLYPQVGRRQGVPGTAQRLNATTLCFGAVPGTRALPHPTHRCG